MQHRQETSTVASLLVLFPKVNMLMSVLATEAILIIPATSTGTLRSGIFPDFAPKVESQARFCGNICKKEQIPVVTAGHAKNVVKTWVCITYAPQNPCNSISGRIHTILINIPVILVLKCWLIRRGVTRANTMEFQEEHIMY